MDICVDLQIYATIAENYEKQKYKWIYLDLLEMCKHWRRRSDLASSLHFPFFVELSFLIVNIIHVAFHAHFTVMWWKKIMILSISWLEAGGRLVTCLFQLAHLRTFLGLFLLCQFSTHDWVKLGCVEICWLCSSWFWWLCCIWLPFTKIFSTPDGFWFWINFNMWMCGSLLTVFKLIGWLVSLCVKEENLIGVCLWRGQLWCRRKAWHGQKTIF